MWSERQTRLPGPAAGRSEPAAFVSTSSSAPSALQRAHRRGDRGALDPLVDVPAAGEDRDVGARQRARARARRRGRRAAPTWKPGRSPYGIATRPSSRSASSPRPGAEHQAEARREAGRALGDDGGRRGHAARCSGPNESGSSSPSVTSCAGPARGRRGGSARRRAGELAQALAAAAARRAQLAAGRGDDHLGDPAAAAGDERADRRRLGALALRVGGVLDVRARVARGRPRRAAAAPTGKCEYGA